MTHASGGLPGGLTWPYARRAVLAVAGYTRAEPQR
jgi:hypothetical protein